MLTANKEDWYLDTPAQRLHKYINFMLYTLLDNLKNSNYKNTFNTSIDKLVANWDVFDVESDPTINIYYMWELNSLIADLMMYSGNKDNIQKLFDISEKIFVLNNRYQYLNDLDSHLRGAKQLKDKYSFVSIQTKLIKKGMDYNELEDVIEENGEWWTDWLELVYDAIKYMIKTLNKEFNLFSENFDNETLTHMTNLQNNCAMIEIVKDLQNN